MKLTLYLFKPAVTDFAQCLKPASQKRKYRDITRADRPDLAEHTRIYAVDAEPKTPSWVSFIAGYAEGEALNALQTRSASALILQKVSTADGDRFFAASYGSGYGLLDTSLLEQGFGLKATLNSIYPNRIKSLDYKNIAARARARREAAASATTIANFGFQQESEVLKAVAGRSADDELGASLSGADSLKISIKDAQLAGLSTIAQKAYDKFKATAYRTHFEFIDYFEPERDPLKIAGLDELLVAAMNRPAPPDGLYAAYPEPAQYAECRQFKLAVHGAQEIFDEIDLPALHRFVRDNAGQVDLNLLKKDAHITGLDHADQARTPRKSVYSFLGFEVAQDGVRYVLSDGKWYKFSADFVAGLDAWLTKHATLGGGAQPAAQPGLALKPWPAAQTEAEYCESYAGDADFYTLRGDFYQPRGHGAIQMASLYQRPANRLVCVKKLAAASSLPHLLSEAATSADLLRDGDDRAWEFLLGRVKDKWPDATREQVEAKLGYVVALGFASPAPEGAAALEALPVFSKIALKQAVKAIRKLGLSVELVKI